MHLHIQSVLICTRHNSTPDRTRTGDSIYQGLPGSDWWTGQDSNPVAGYGASWGLFPQSIPRWARAEALDRPTGTTVAALDARRRVPRRPDVVQLDAGEIAGNDRVPLGGRVRPSPSPPGGRRSRRRGQLLASRPSTCAGGNFQESGPRPSKSPISRRSGRNRRAMTGREALGAVRVGCLSPPKNRSCPPHWRPWWTCSA